MPLPSSPAVQRSSGGIPDTDVKGKIVADGFVVMVVVMVVVA